MENVIIDNKIIGDDHPCYIIAEIGTGYRNYDEAKNLIDSAIKSGINAIKFQTFEANTITTKNNFIDMGETGKISQYDLFKQLEIPKETQKKIVKYANENNITIFSAPSHLNDLEFLKELDLPVYKIGSDLACHIPLLKEIAKLQKPIILSTGMCSLDEIHESINAIKSMGNDQIILLHCVSDYPAKIEDSNLNAILTLKKEFNIPVGFSDHSIGTLIPTTAATLGANIVEKHFRDIHNTSSPDDIHSLTKEQFSDLIQSIRIIEKAKGIGIKEPVESEQKNKITNRVSIIAISDIKKGSKIVKTDVDIRRPGTGMAPKHFDSIIGKKAIRNISHDEPIMFEDLE
jgi:N-acetylneuraminate synthase